MNAKPNNNVNRYCIAACCSVRLRPTLGGLRNKGIEMGDRANLPRQFAASSTGLVLIVALVTGLAYLFMSDDKPEVVAILGNMFAIPMAIAAWTGVLWKSKESAAAGPRTPRDWLIVFLCSSVFAVIFIAIDLVIVHPGLTAAFTIGACSISVIALPSAVRAWILADYK